jgi:hypothetical protein
MAAIDLTAGSNPVPVAEKDMVTLYQAAVEGRLPG